MKTKPTLITRRARILVDGFVVAYGIEIWRFSDGTIEIGGSPKNPNDLIEERGSIKSKLSGWEVKWR